MIKDLNNFMTEAKCKAEVLDKWYVKGINRKIITIKFLDKVSAVEAATRALEKEMIDSEKIIMNKKILVYGTYSKAPSYSFLPDVIAANAGYYSLKS
jgi:hypothetical protein